VELVLPSGLDGTVRPQARQGNLHPDLVLRLPGPLRLLTILSPAPTLPRLRGRGFSAAACLISSLPRKRGRVGVGAPSLRVIRLAFFAEGGDAFGEVAAGADPVAERLFERLAALRVIGDRGPH